ncbi:CHAT domain-containing protein [Pseudofrankia sp. BMG5.37]|uniref:CHAT domain-containing protein n=1 Tax=Pseudofrankia sp. BMG5.37 TaxID=3050035 RepID=UPI002893B23D|nr:CHAT domain-containing protein [Pseudofrankia sp. BMG5.37]MDT3439457.1 CHAT domain-containing protein [Pseudofrankia sp. BMG5.37]
MNVEGLVLHAEALMGVADEQDVPWPERTAAFEEGASILMDATTMSDEVGHLDRLLYVGDGVVTTPLLRGERLAPPSPDLISAYLWMAEANLELFEFRMRVTDLRQAATALRTAADLQTLQGENDPVVGMRCAVVQARLAAYRTETFETDGDLAAATEALDAAGADNAVAAGWLARCLRLQAAACADPEGTLRGAVRLLQQVLQAPLPQTPVLPWLEAAWGADLARCQLDIYALTGLQTDLNIAFNWATQALEKQRSSVPAGCAMARAARIALGTKIPVGIEDVEEWHDALILLGGRNWHGWLLAREYAAWCGNAGRPEGVVQARYVYDTALQTAEAESGPAERRTWLREIAALAPLVTDRLFADDTPGATGYRLERGRALILRERFADEYTELREVIAAGMGGLASELREALNATRSERIGVRGRDIAATRLAQLTDQLRRVVGFERFRGWLEPDEVAESAGGEPLIYLLPGPTGGWMVGHDPDSGWFHQHLPLCRTDEIPASVRRFHKVIRTATLPAGARRHAVTAVSNWLWDAVYVPLRPHIERRTCHVVAHGYLANLPIHAAQRADGSAPAAVHESDIRYVPSARSLAHSRRTLQDADPHDQVFLGVPPPSGAAIAAAEREMALVAQWFPRAVLLRAGERSRADVVRAAQTAGWLHASCHGVADANDPLNSGLLLAGEERLTLGDLARATIGHLTLAVLSACQTAVPDPELPNEELSLAAGFLTAGCGAVVASSWQVPDQATGALMTHFYRAWRREGRTPAEALRTAQLRLAETGEDADGTAVTAWRDPYFWASFRYLGW